MPVPPGRSPFHGRPSTSTSNRGDSPLSFSLLGAASSSASGANAAVAAAAAARMSFGTTTSFTSVTGGAVQHWTSVSNNNNNNNNQHRLDSLGGGGNNNHSIDLSVSTSFGASQTQGGTNRSSLGSSRTTSFTPVGAGGGTGGVGGGRSTTPRSHHPQEEMHTTSTTSPHFGFQQSFSAATARLQPHSSSSRKASHRRHTTKTPPPPSAITAVAPTTTVDPSSPPQHPSSSPNDRLRSLTLSSLRNGTSLPGACFYASILLTRTNLPSDALLYARVLMANDEGRRAVFLLEKRNLLLPPLNSSPVLVVPAFDTVGDGNGEAAYDASIPTAEMLIRAALLASRALSKDGDYDDALAILERTCRFPLHPLATSAVAIDDADDPRLLTLARQMRDNGALTTDVNPVAELCCARGRVYDELGNPGRAKDWFAAALGIDAWCVEAWDGIVERRLMNGMEERELLEGLDWGEETQEGCICWLRDVYLARCSGGGGERDTNTFHDTNDAIPTPHSHTPPPDSFLSSPNFPSAIHDASSIHNHTALTPSPHHLPTPKRPPTLPPTFSSLSLSPSTAFSRLHTLHSLSLNPEILSFAAIHAYNLHSPSLSASFSRHAHTIDPLTPRALFVHAASLLSLSHKRDLYHLAHTLVESSPRSAAGWFAVGCYYLLCRKYDVAQRHFCRATRLEPRCAPAWIGFGCAFAAADESDQALASFRAAQRLDVGGYVALLYMGMEYSRTNHLSLAGHFLGCAKRMEPEDPLSWNELGVVCYKKGDWGESVDCFRRSLELVGRLGRLRRELGGLEGLVHGNEGCGWGETLRRWECDEVKGDQQLRSETDDVYDDEDVVKSVTDAFWEPVLFNLGQSYRKMRHFEDATRCFEKAIALCPGKATSYAALGYTKHLTGDIDGAISSYHQALGIKPDDPFTGEMLSRALRESFVMPDPLLHKQFDRQRYHGLQDADDNTYPRDDGSTTDSTISECKGSMNLTLNKSLTFLNSSEERGDGMAVMRDEEEEESHFTLDSSVDMSMS